MRAYLEFSPIKKEIDHLNKIYFGAKIVNAYELPSNFVVVLIDWNSAIDSHKIKYAKQGCTISSSDKIVGVELRFEDYPYEMEDSNCSFSPTINVKLSYKSKRKLEYVCFHNLKYGAAVYFALEGWNDSKNRKKIDF